MLKMLGVQKLVSQMNLMVIGTAMLLANLGFAANLPQTQTQTQTQIQKNRASNNSSFSDVKRVKRVKKNSSHQAASARPVSLVSSQTQKVNLNQTGLKVLSTNKNYVSKDQSYQAPVTLAANTRFKRKTVLQRNSMSADLALDNDDKVISGAVSLSYERSLIDFQDGSRSESQTANIQLSGKLSDNWTTSLETAVTQDNRDSENIKNGLSDTRIIVSQKRSKITDSLQGGFSFSTLLPTSKYSNEHQGLQSLLGISYGVGFLDDILADGLKLSFGIGVSRLFHKYETDVAGTVLNQTSLRESIGASYSFHKFTMTLDLNHRSAWTYQNNIKQAYEATEEISYAILPSWGVSLGHTNSDAWLKPNGQDSNLKLINENNSIVYISSSVMF